MKPTTKYSQCGSVLIRMIAVFLQTSAIHLITQDAIGQTNPPPLVNGSFENGFSGWQFDSSTIIFGPLTGRPSAGVDGSNFANIGTFNVSNGYVSQAVTLIAGATYRLAFATLANDNGKVGAMTVVQAVVSNSFGAIYASQLYTNFAVGTVSGTAGFTTRSLDFTIPATNPPTSIAVVVAFVDKSPSGPDVGIDDVRLTQIQSPPSNNLSIVPNGGTFTNSIQVSITSSLGVGDTRYTLDGTNPTTNSTLYLAPFQINSSLEVRALVFVNGFPVTEIASAKFEKAQPPPTIQFTPGAGLFTNFVQVRITNSLNLGVVRYTLDGTSPTTNSTLYTNAVTLSDARTIQARAFLNNFPVTDVFSASYARVYALNDGIAASWRLQYFGTNYLTDPRVAADADPDGDGSSNLQEFIAGSNPLDPKSGFASGIQLIPMVTWTSVSNTVYRILRKDTLTSTNWIIVSPLILATNAVSAYVDSSTVGRNAFYVVEAVPNP